MRTKGGRMITQRHHLRPDGPVVVARAQRRVRAAVRRANRCSSNRAERRLIEAFDRLVEREA